jgi:hypothetical protein
MADFRAASQATLREVAKPRPATMSGPAQRAKRKACCREGQLLQNPNRGGPRGRSEAAEDEEDQEGPWAGDEEQAGVLRAGPVVWHTMRAWTLAL